MNNNKLTQVEANLMIDDLVRIVSENPQELDWLCDAYVWYASDKEIDKLRTLIKDEYGYD